MSVFEKLVKTYDKSLNYDGVDGERLANRIDTLSKIGASPGGGVTRIGFSDEEKEAKAEVITWMKEAGLTVETDGVGNVFARFKGKDDHSSIASGSHVDSVPEGGNFDGPLGVLAALEVVEAWKTEGFIPEKSFEVVIFSDEEGSRFNSGIFGSRSYMGLVDEASQSLLKDNNGRTLEEVLDHYGTSIDEYRSVKKRDWEFFAELHIEQGKVLEKNNQPAGVVSGIAGPAWLEVEFKGVAGHAGNTPMNDRKDALVAAGQFVSEIESLPGTVSETAVTTVGKLEVYPNGANVIPESVKMIVDIRDIFKETRDEVLKLVENKAQNISGQRGIEVSLSTTTKITPVPIAEEYRAEIAGILKEMEIEPLEIPSGAGHDSMIIGSEIPVAMIFARSENGISHNPEEWTTLNDCVTSVHVLKEFIEKQMTK
ncbi:M20 family metallo-hydrolase [Corticicoccus populi]|uniref:M20 family metallo-hydrolase n=1 Tax=Corticicoccus populi TaxID=1812821 RepID=A0ABW5WZT6_9STAP